MQRRKYIYIYEDSWLLDAMFAASCGGRRPQDVDSCRARAFVCVCVGAAEKC